MVDSAIALYYLHGGSATGFGAVLAKAAVDGIQWERIVQAFDSPYGRGRAPQFQEMYLVESAIALFSQPGGGANGLRAVMAAAEAHGIPWEAVVQAFDSPYGRGRAPQFQQILLQYGPGGPARPEPSPRPEPTSPRPSAGPSPASADAGSGGAAPPPGLGAGRPSAAPPPAAPNPPMDRGSLTVTDVSRSAPPRAGVPARGSGESMFDPARPTPLAPGHFHFTDVPSGLWYDPPAVFGFQYVMTDPDSLFTRILDFPAGFDGPFIVSAGGTALGTFTPGTGLVFPGGGVSEFTLTGISPGVDANDPTAFPLRLEFNTRTASFEILALDSQVVPEPGSLALFSAGLVALEGIAWRWRLRPGVCRRPSTHGPCAPSGSARQVGAPLS